MQFQKINQLKISQAFFLISAFVVALAGYVITSGKIADHDAFVMGEVVQRLAEGKTLYTETWDNKPPLALLFYYPAQVLAPHSYLVQQIFTFLWTAVQACAVFFLLSGEKSWIRVVIATLVLWTPLSRTDFAWGSSEDAVNGFTILLAVLGYRVLRNGWISSKLWLVCGLAAGLAFHTRQPGILFLGLPLAAMVISARPWSGKMRALGMTVSGCIIAFMAIVGIMLIVSDWSSYVDIMFNKPIQYSGANSYIARDEASLDMLGENSWEVGSTLSMFMTMLIDKFHVIRSVLLEHFSQLGMDILLVIPVLAIFMTTGWRWRLIAMMLICISMAVVLLPMKLFSHYHQQLIPAFVLGTLFLLRRFDEVSPHLAKSFAIALLGVMLFKVGLTAEALRRDDGEQADMNEVVHVIEAESHEHDTLFAVGKNSAYIYYRSTMEPCHKFHWDKFFGWLAIYLPQNIDTIINDIVEKPPDWIAIDRDAHEKFLLNADETKDGIVQTGELLRGLNKKHAYKLFDEIGRWLVLRRT